jgi:hypothetical protein
MLEKLSYNYQDKQGSKLIVIQIGKLKCSVRGQCCRLSETTYGKKNGLCCYLHLISTVQDMPHQKDWGFSRFIICRISRLLLQNEQVSTQVIMINMIFYNLECIVEPYMKLPQSIYFHPSLLQ